MINVTKEQLHNCVYISLSDFKSIINKLKPELIVSCCDNKLSIETSNGEPADKEEILKTLSLHFNVTVTGFHADDSDDIGVWVLYKDNVYAKDVPCRKCYNARFDDELTDENDFGSYTVGQSEKNYRMIYSSGHGKPPRIEFDSWSEECKRWLTVGVYFPGYCPECGREITEYDDKKRRKM